MSAKAFEALSKSLESEHSPQTAHSQEKSDNENNEKIVVARKNLIRFGSLAVLAFVVWLFATIAWFTMNRETSAGGMSIKTAGMPFEISVDAPYTTRPDYSPIIESEFGYSTTIHETGGSTDAIKWVMTDDTFDSTNPNRGLRPGSKGSFTFNIVPKSVGTYTIYFKPNLTGYYAEFNYSSGTQVINPESIKTDASDNYILQTLSERATAKHEEYLELTEAGNTADANIAQKEETACTKAETFLNGHILIFEAYEDGCYSKLRPINQTFSKEFTFTQAQIDSNAKIPVTIYWIWPNTFGQFLLDEGNTRLHDKAMFDSEQAAISGVTPRQELINYICAHPNYYFESTNASITSGSTLPAYIEGAMGDSPDNLLSLSNGYNNADQIIGENIQILLAEMTVGLTEE
ncbi:hypothetical protein [Ruminococcus flavefaciens]|uniref:hypothetical protein n=1 Tax=Ruminococcus flavefaciens TaxID=1265 RepID=UPI0026F12438|nr:hypothetical protein [Ruminococcus flavefaciens]